MPSNRTSSKKHDISIGLDLDTSDVLSELCARYQQSGEAVEVDFRKMVGWVRLGDQLTHQLHPYPAKLLPNIANFFVRASVLQHKRKLVLDPFCGSGTVALEASAAGQTALVADANPLALLIAKAKTTPFDDVGLRSIARGVVTRAKRIRTAPEIDIVNAQIWYTPDRKSALERISRAILEIEDRDTQDFLRVCLSVTARKVSFADPAISVPVRMREKSRLGQHHSNRVQARLQWLEKADVITEFSRVCEANIDRVREANLAHPMRTAAVEVGEDARNLRDPNSKRSRLRSGSVPLIITSPPYGSAQKYIRAVGLSLNWLNLARPAELASLEARSIGREHIPSYSYTSEADVLPAAYSELCRKVEAVNPTRAKITKQYLCDLKSALQEMARVTAKNGHVVLVIGNNEVCGNTLRNDIFASHVLQESGMKLKLSMIDHIKSRGLMTKRNKTASVISRESVLVFSK